MTVFNVSLSKILMRKDLFVISPAIIDNIKIISSGIIDIWEYINRGETVGNTKDKGTQAQ